MRKVYDRAEVAKKIPDAGGIDVQRTATLLCDVMENYEEQDARSFGIATLWIGDHEHAADVLRGLRLRDAGEISRKLRRRPGGTRRRTPDQKEPPPIAPPNLVRDEPRSAV